CCFPAGTVGLVTPSGRREPLRPAQGEASRKRTHSERPAGDVELRSTPFRERAAPGMACFIAVGREGQGSLRRRQARAGARPGTRFNRQETVSSRTLPPSGNSRVRRCPVLPSIPPADTRPCPSLLALGPPAVSRAGDQLSRA